MIKKRVLTGITPSGTPHLGNYVGSIRPAIAASQSTEVESFYFLADLHALIKCQDPARVQRSTLEIAASWLACGLNPARTYFYRQSDVPETAELMWLLTCSTGKGLLNRAHAYKAMVDKNLLAEQEPDHNVTAGLFMYPVLMAADILLFKANQVPVGRDQIQHIEMARDIATSFNHSYGEHFVLPQALIDEQVATLPGLDGRKMSKSYNNTIQIFAPAEQVKKQIFSILTDSKAANEAKSTENSAIFQLYQAFANKQETEQMRQDFAAGKSWAELKTKLYQRIEAEIEPMRAKYQQLMANPQQVEDILQAGATKLRAESQAFIKQLKTAVGMKSLSDLAVTAKPDNSPTKTADNYQFKQYREKDGLFYFKLTNQKNRSILQSKAFTDPKQAGAAISQLKTNGVAALASLQQQLQPLSADEYDAVKQVLDNWEN